MRRQTERGVQHHRTRSLVTLVRVCVCMCVDVCMLLYVRYPLCYYGDVSNVHDHK
jgi:hypothetical protein